MQLTSGLISYKGRLSTEHKKTVTASKESHEYFCVNIIL